MRRAWMWRAVIAGAVIGLVEAAGIGRARKPGRRPLRVVWIDDREPGDPLAGTGVWFLEPIGDPRPAPADFRPRGADGVRLHPLVLARVLEELRPRRS